MTTRTRRLAGTRPSAETLAAALRVLARDDVGGGELQVIGSLSRASDLWHLVGAADVLAEYATGVDRAVVTVRAARGQLDVVADLMGATVSATAPTRGEAERLVDLLSGGAATQRSARPRVFVGHGPHDHWRLLTDLLRGQHGLEILTFEAAARGGLSVTEVLHDLVSRTSFAVLVHTRDYVDEHGVGHASDNVVYETGYFQALLGPRRAVVVREDGCAEYANVTGANQLRFRSGDIAAVVGDVLAVLRREFPEL